MFKWIIRTLLFLLWLVSSIVMGGLVLSAKESLGINVFTSTGYHAFGTCLKNEYKKALDETISTETVITVD